MAPHDSAPHDSAPLPHARGAVPVWALVLAAVAMWLSLLWDYSWEATIGIDLPWSPPHVATHVAMWCAGLVALASAGRSSRGVRIAGCTASVGAWVALWGALAFAVAFFFDRWWQAGYGLVAGIWHPPQCVKAAGFFAVAGGAWLLATSRERGLAAAAAGGVVLGLVFVVTLPLHFANRQHSASFYLSACATHPLVLVALATAGRVRLSATLAALVAMSLIAVMVWVLPLVPGSPQVAPIHQPRTHLLPPPFPLLLVAPALALDLLLRVFPRKGTAPGWGQALEAGAAFFVVLLAVQWPFAEFLLSPAADHWFFAGGGKQWPFFLRIDPAAKTTFWTTGDALGWRAAALSIALAALGARLGLWLGAWARRLQR